MVVVSLRERALGESARDMSTFARGCRATIRELRTKFRLEDTEQNRELQEAFKDRSDRRILHALNACNDAKMVCKSYQQKVGRQMETLKKKVLTAPGGGGVGGGAGRETEGVAVGRTEWSGVGVKDGVEVSMRGQGTGKLEVGGVDGRTGVGSARPTGGSCPPS